MVRLLAIQVLPSMFVIKAHGAEGSEQWRFNRLAWIEREAQLNKKRMKAFIPEIITLVYGVTTTVILAVGTWAISKGTLDAAGMVSFITSLLLLLDPMQVCFRCCLCTMSPCGSVLDFRWH
jgi:putative ABC transport system ATP-binding protein